MRKLFSLFALLTLSAGMWAMNGVKYINANGQEQTVNDVTEITNTSSTLDAGWYIVKGSYVTSGQLICQGSVHLILADGAKLTATGAFNQAGIEVSGTGNSLTIYGQAAQTGQLFAFGGENGAGIGGGNHASGFDITINGGTVTATGGKHGAGIGGGNRGAGINITINGGTVTATGGADAAGIGGGYLQAGSHITINGGTVTATGGKNGAGIGGGNQGAGINITINGGTVTATGGEDAAGIGGGYDSFTLNIFVDADLIVRADNFNPPVTEIQPERTVKTDITGDLVGKRYVNIRPEPVAIPVAYINKNGEEQNVEAYLIDSINFPHTLPFVWGRHGKTTWYVVKEADMQILGGAFCYGDAHLILADGAKLTVRGDNNKAGIQVSGDGNLLTIYGQAAQTGQLFATGGERGAGIGGNDGCPGSNITIIGGMVTANGGKYGAGIGGGNGQNGSNISIYGGVVTANGGSWGAGIGGGGDNSGSNISIYGGTVTATGGDRAACIGGGLRGQSSNIKVNKLLAILAGNGNPPVEEFAVSRSSTTDIAGSLAGKQSVTIKLRTESALASVPYQDENGIEQTVKAYTILSSDTLVTLGKADTTMWYFVINEMDTHFSKGAVCIGDVRLILGDSSKLTATGVKFGAGIQVSGKANSLAIYVQAEQSGQLVANGGYYGAGIGGGREGSASNITIHGGIITADGGENAAGIGGGAAGSGSNITVNRGTVTAKGGKYGAGIGGGWQYSGSNIAINGGKVTATGGADAAGIGGGSGASGSNITIEGGEVIANGGERASGIGGGYNRSGSNIFVNPFLVVKADNNNPPTTVIANDGGDLTGSLKGKLYVTIEDPSDDTALPTLPYERKVGKGSFKVMENGQFRIIRNDKRYTIMGVEE